MLRNLTLYKNVRERSLMLNAWVSDMNGIIALRCKVHGGKLYVARSAGAKPC